MKWRFHIAALSSMACSFTVGPLSGLLMHSLRRTLPQPLHTLYDIPAIHGGIVRKTQSQQQTVPRAPRATCGYLLLFTYELPCIAGGQSTGVQWVVGNRGGHSIGRQCYSTFSWPLPSDILKTRRVD